MIEVKYIDHMGSDLSVVNAARVSFDKKSDWVTEVDYSKGHITCETLSDKDKKLVKYLAEHGHWTPFGHAALSVHIKAPIFVARQLGKHQVGLVWNEISRRYVDNSPEFFWPNMWRGTPQNKKQGSTGYVEEHQTVSDINYKVYNAYEACREAYEHLLDKGVCPEQARMVLPQAMFTEWYWSGSLAAFARIANLRLKEDTQKETRDVAIRINEIAEGIFPCVWKELVNA